ncbi:TadE/TadG family type IV pilus assembly protein [Pseudoclavibacter sp. Z016]|uniref:TadE/TadG family type IV pilus assembly protein n=1 Tax=Pseudoclavibacter sp. Z016 TaxID=2080581 RepID=UPI002157E796|nr:TadE/TadG family type IV pilus assembly protein [Pseudoclavibacter sp. Z016]
MTSTSRPHPRGVMRDETGSAVAEWVMVSAMLLLLTLTVLQVGFALHVRTTLLDAAGEGARHAGLFGGGLEAGETRAADLITVAIGPGYAQDVTATTTETDGSPTIAVTVRSPLPLIGLIGLPDALEVTGHAPTETLETE